MSESKPAIQLTYRWANPGRDREIMLNLYAESVAQADELAAGLMAEGLIPAGLPLATALVEAAPAIEATPAPAPAPAPKPAPKPQRRLEEGVDDFDEVGPYCLDHTAEAGFGPMLRSTKTAWEQWFCPRRTDDGSYCHWQWTPKSGHRAYVRRSKGAA